MLNAEKALEWVADGMAIGLGSGHAAERFIHALAERVAGGLTVRAVPTSEATAALARQLGISLTTLDEAMPLAVTIDGADEVDAQLNLIKGYGHALVREKIVAAASKKLVILIGPEHVDEKVVDVLGRRGKLPVEVVPYGLALCRRRLLRLGLEPKLVGGDASPLVTDNGNYILECGTGAIADAAALERDILAIPGVVGAGLFLEMADVVLIEQGDKLIVRERTAWSITLNDASDGM